MFHIYGLGIITLYRMVDGLQVVTLPKFTPDTFLNALEKYQASLLHLVPPLVNFLGNYDKVEKRHTESVKYILCGAGPIGKLDIERLNSKMPHIQVQQGYGMTESSSILALNYKKNGNYTSVGQLAPFTEAKVVEAGDPTFKGLGPNQTGEILVRGPQIMKGYLNNPEATKQTILEDGFMRTGDIGYYDEHGDFYITDRLKELIKMKGLQVPPAELEELLRSHPMILDAGVIGKPHSTFGEVPLAFVVKKAEVEVTEKEIREFIADKVAPYKRLEGGVRFIDSIPKTASGKILRRTLKELI